MSDLALGRLGGARTGLAGACLGLAATTGVLLLAPSQLGAARGSSSAHTFCRGTLSCPPHPACLLAAELYDVAVAYVADGTAGRRPGQLARALHVLQAAAAAAASQQHAARGQAGAGDVRIKQAAERRAQDERSRRAVAASVCYLLLGETDEAHRALGLVPGRASETGLVCDRSLLGFIKVRRDGAL